MIQKIFITILSIGILGSSLHAGMNDGLHGFINKPYPSSNDSLKILIAHDKPGVVLEVKGRYQVFDPNTNTILGNRFSGKRKYLQPLQDGLRWGEEFPGVFQLLIQPDDKNTTTIVDGIEYKGRIYIYDIGNSISVVNEIPFDEYVRASISSKIPQTLPEEAIAALVITARTNANYLKENTRNKFWNVEAEQIAYQGFALSNPSPLIDKIVRATHNMILNQNAASFIAKWDRIEAKAIPSKEPIVSKISIDQAAMFAHQGDHAAKILKKAFPDADVKILSE